MSNRGQHVGGRAGALALAAMALLCAAWAPEDEQAAGEPQRALAAVQPALVRVEYDLQYDQGEEPTGAGWTERCPACGQFHVQGNAGELVRQHRPKELGGYLVAPQRVLTLDLQVHPRFVKSIAVRFKDQVVSAKPVAYARTQNAILLELAEPLRDAQPLQFKPDAAGPYYAVTYQHGEAGWATNVRALESAVVARETGEQVHPAPTSALIVNGAGVPVGAEMNGELPLDDSWKGAPADWPAMSAPELAQLLGRIQSAAEAGVPAVTLRFRSPRKSANPYAYRGEEDESATEAHTLGVLCDDRTLLVLSELPPKRTARLEQIEVRLRDGTTRPARFRHTLTDYGCFVAELEAPLTGAIPVANMDIRELRQNMLVGAEFIPYGTECTRRYMSIRSAGFTVGFRRQIFPRLAQTEDNLFLFGTDGALLAVPMSLRNRGDDEDRWQDDRLRATPLAYVTRLMSDLASHTDPSNVPLTEEEENRLAWLGVELQNLDAELARANNVSELTRDGEEGALVAFVYPNSPAAAAGVQPGWILLRLHPAERPKPIPVRTDDDQYGGNFPWDRLDDAPEDVFDRIPTPWPSVDNTFNRALTDLGFGKALQAEFHDGQKIVMKDFAVVQSPPHYDAAPRYKSEPLGLTVRDLTYEVRRYFQKQDDEPGVIIARIEPGSRASVAGLKPFEIITHVNNQPIASVTELEPAIRSSGDELRLNVMRMHKGRVVKIKVSAADSGAASSQPATPDGDKE